jgi:hypothetical protein
MIADLEKKALPAAEETPPCPPRRAKRSMQRSNGHD